MGRLLRAALPEETLGVDPQRIFLYTDGALGVPSRVEVSLKEPNAVRGYRVQTTFFDP